MNYFGSERSSSSSSYTGGSSSSRKGKKSGSDKPKQPQRGLGVAQLEQIRLHSQIGFLPQEDIRIQISSSSSFSYNSPSTTSINTLQGHHSHMIDMGELDRTNHNHESQIANINPRWNASSTMFDPQHYAQPAGVSRHLFSPESVEDSLRNKKRKDENESRGSNSGNSDSNGSQEVDLELRLSL